MALVRLTQRQGESAGGYTLQSAWFDTDLMSYPNADSDGNVSFQYADPQGMVREVTVVESRAEFDWKVALAQGNPSTAYLNAVADLTVSASGAASAGAYALSKYFNIVSAATATSRDDIALPAQGANTWRAIEVLNNSGQTLTVWTASTAETVGGAISASLADGAQKTFVTKASTGDWTVLS